VVGGLRAAALLDGFSNVDDFLYARQAQVYYNGLRNGPVALVDAWQEFPFLSALVPTLTAPLTRLTADPNLLISVQLVFVLALFAGAVVLVQALGRTRSEALVIAAAVACLPGVLIFAVKLHFAVAAAAASIWTCAAYLRSNGCGTAAGHSCWGRPWHCSA